MSARPDTRSLSEISGHLRQIADLFDASGIERLPAPAQVSVYVSPAIGGAASVALVDAVAAALGAQPTWERNSGSEFAWYSTGLNPDDAVWSVRSSTYTRHPFGDLRSENDALRARLAEIESLAGGVRTSVPVAPAQTAPDLVPPVIDGSQSDLDVPVDGPILDSGGYLPCGCLGTASEHSCQDGADESDEPDAFEFNGVHATAGGRAGGPGACAAWCACGATFDGFDTHREAAQWLDTHIAAENGEPFPSTPDGGDQS